MLRSGVIPFDAIGATKLKDTDICILILFKMKWLLVLLACFILQSASWGQGMNAHWLLGYTTGIDTNVVFKRAIFEFDSLSYTLNSANFKMPFCAAQSNLSDENGNWLLLSNVFLTHRDFAKADSMLDVVDLLTDDTCLTAFDRKLISLMEDTLSLFDLTFEEWQNYQTCIESSESTSLHYEIIEDILDFVNHPREPEVPASLRVLNTFNQDDEIKNNQFMVLNNPGKGEFTINWAKLESSEDVYLMYIYNVLGKSVLIKRVKATEGTVSLELRNANSGVYLLRIVSENESRIKCSFKLLKQ
ncbi:MAG: T9SS type A sorting domain-containing protein [Bacteroidetes bacterium]|nr:T9SS type A sorting domain-containing protein [Bacteroidota bacterium]